MTRSEEIPWREQENASSLEEKLRLVWDGSFQTRRKSLTDKWERDSPSEETPPGEPIEQERGPEVTDEPRGATAHTAGTGTCLPVLFISILS